MQNGLQVGPKELGKRISDMRERAGISQDALAEATGLSRPHLSKIEGGGVNPSLLTLSTIVDECGSSLTQLFGGHVQGILRRQGPALTREAPNHTRIERRTGTLDQGEC